MTVRAKEKRFMVLSEALFLKGSQRGTNVFKGKLGPLV